MSEMIENIKALFETIGYEPEADCSNCGRKNKECQVLRTADFTAAYCKDCSMRESKKRSMNGKKP